MVDNNTALNLCPDGEESKHDDLKTEDLHTPLAVQEVFDEVPSLQRDVPDGLHGVGSNDGPSSCDNISDVIERLDEEITVEAVDVESNASCPGSLGIEERMVEEEEVHQEVYQEEENEYEAPVQIDVCGEDVVPEMSAYEKLRERNIREREEMMKEVMEEINEAKQEMHDFAPKRKRVDIPDDEHKFKRRKMKEAEVVQVRRSERERKPVSYVFDDDNDRKSRPKKKNSGLRPEAPIYEEVSTSAGLQGRLSSRTLRPRKPVCYTEFQRYIFSKWNRFISPIFFGSRDNEDLKNLNS